MNISLRRQLAVWLSASILVTGALATVLSFWLAREAANDLQDAQLVQLAAVLAAGTVLPAPPKFEPRGEEDAEIHLVIKPLGTGRLDPDPEVDLLLPATLPSGLQSLEQSGVRWRAVVSQNTAGQRFAVAQRMTVRDEAASESALLTLLPLVVAVPVLLLIARFVLVRAFAPMAAVSAEVDRLDGLRLAPLDERHVPVEALPLVQAVNRLMRRLTVALDQQRRFIADAAHELRTPVAALIVQADNVSHVELPRAARARMAALRQGLARMSSLIDQLLSLARMQDAAPGVPQCVELSALVRAAIEDILPLAQAKGVDLGCLRIERVTVEGDPLHAQALVRNVIDNAVRYTSSGGTVDVTLSAQGSDACLIVEDTGPGIGPDDVERVFKPFVRLLGHTQTGSGLGLAIVRKAAQRLGGHIELGARTDRRSGLRFAYRQVRA